MGTIKVGGGARQRLYGSESMSMLYCLVGKDHVQNVFFVRPKLIGGWGDIFHPKMKINDENMFSYYAEGHFLTFYRELS